MKVLYNCIFVTLLMCVSYTSFAQTAEEEEPFTRERLIEVAENYVNSCEKTGDNPDPNVCNNTNNCVPRIGNANECTAAQANSLSDVCFSCKNFVKEMVSAANGTLGANYCSPYLEMGHEVPYWEAKPGDLIQISQQSHSTFNSCSEDDSEEFIIGVHSAIFSKFVSNDDLYNIEVIDANRNSDRANCFNRSNDCLSSSAEHPFGWATWSGCVQRADFDVKDYFNDPEGPFIHIYRPGTEHYDHPVIKPSKQNPTSCSAEDTVYESGIPVRCGSGIVSTGSGRFLVQGDTANTFIDFEYVTKPFQVKIEAYREDDSVGITNHPMMLDWTFEDPEWIHPTPSNKARYHFDFENLRLHKDLAEGENPDNETHTQWEFRVYIREEGDADFTARPKNVFGYKVVPTGTQAYVEDVFPNDWSYSHEIVIDHTQVVGEHDFYDFPIVLIEATLPVHLLYNASRDGSDIRFTSDMFGLNPIPFDIERYQHLPGNPEGFFVTIHVKVPHLKVDEDTSIYVWYGNENCDLVHPSDPNGSYNVWDPDYKAVWHLGEESGMRYDSTMNDNNLTDNNGVESDESVLGRGALFGGYRSNHFLSIEHEDQTGLNVSSSLTFEAWITIDSIPWRWGSGRSQYIFSKTGGRYYNNSYYCYFSRQSKIGFKGGASQTRRYGDYERYFHEFMDIVAKQQYHFVVVRNAEEGAYEIYIDGELVEYSPTEFYNVHSTNEVPFKLSHHKYDFNGVMDEVRFSDIPRNADYIRTQYNNQNDPWSFATPAD